MRTSAVVSGLQGIPRTLLIIAVLGLTAGAEQQTFASGVVTTCAEAALRTAMSGGGTVTFACDGTITLTNSLNIDQTTVLDATGHNVVVDGNGTVRLFTLQPGSQLTLNHLTLMRGAIWGADGAPSFDGSPAGGGAVLADHAILNLVACRVWTNSASGGDGGDGSSAGSGGQGLGGAIWVIGGALNATDSEFVGNAAIGGPAGRNPSGNDYLAVGGEAMGGGICLSNSTLSLNNCRFSLNQARGGGTQSDAESAGAAYGGAPYSDGGTGVVARCDLDSNSAFSPRPNGPMFGLGADVGGGAVCNARGSLDILATTLVANVAAGGSGVRAGTGGVGHGGAICNFDQLSVSGSVCRNNQVTGGGSGGGGSAGGGAVFNGGQMQIRTTEFVANAATGGTGTGGLGPYGGGPGSGGAVFSTNSMSVSDCTFTSNQANGAPGCVLVPAGYGGAIWSSGACSLTNLTLAANCARAGENIYSIGGAYGGGIYSEQGVLTAVHLTLAGNSAVGGTSTNATMWMAVSLGGALFATDTTVTLQNCILADSPSGSNVFGAVADAGNNLSSDATPVFTAPGSRNDTDPKLGPLGDYGGPTPTMPLLAGSPAIDAGSPAFCPPTDQRGHARPFGAGCDIGAFESSPPYSIRGALTGYHSEVALLVLSVSSSGGGPTEWTFTNHTYTAGNLWDGEYSLPVEDDQSVFAPLERSFALGPDVVDADFKGYQFHAVTPELQGDDLLLVFAGTASQTVQWLISTNLTDWQPVFTNTIGPNRLAEYVDRNATSQSLHFFRTASP